MNQTQRTKGRITINDHRDDPDHPDHQEDPEEMTPEIPEDPGDPEGTNRDALSETETNRTDGTETSK